MSHPVRASSESEKDRDYARYKAIELARPAKPSGPNCDDIKKNRDYWKNVGDSRQGFTDKYYGGAGDAGHAAKVAIARVQQAKYDRLMKDLGCSDDCK